MTTYTVGDSLMLTCTVDPMPSISSIVTYLWECSDCFANQMTTQNITRALTDMDNGGIDCTVTIDGTNYMSEMTFELEVTQGSCLL